ncbi:MAG: RecB-like helicase [Campylobacter sp.]|nr:RecB-like helicase [Campylobacter sp.]
MIENFLALKASAGSGKTFALSVRYIALLLNGADPKSITALTFTNKAANEMSSRIISTFMQLHSDAKKAERNELAKILNISENEVIKKRDLVKDDFLNAKLKITTFDAFFALILRLFSLNLGLSPNFESQDKLEFDTESKFIDKLSSSHVLLNDFIDYVINSENSKNSFLDNLENMFLNIENLSFAPSPMPSDVAVMQVIEWFKQNISPEDKTYGIFDKTKTPHEMTSQAMIQKHCLADHSWFKKFSSPEFEIKFDDLKLALKNYFNELEAYKLAQISKYIEIYKDLRLEYIKQNDKLSFNDTNKLVYKLMSGIDKDMLYFRLDSTIKHLLIDEFQDTSVSQYDIIKPLIAEILAGYGQKGLGSFFYVGDTKQGIYRFRGGKKELFDKLKNDFSQIKEDNLNYNYRSAKILVEFVNETFKKKFPAYSPYIPQIPTQKDGVDRPGYVEVCQDNDIIAKSVEKVKFLHENGVNFDDICILCWKNDDIYDISKALEENNIQSKVEGKIFLKNDPAVFGLINYAKFCLFGDEIYRQNAKTFYDADFTKLSLNPAKTACESLLYLAKMAKISLKNLNVLYLLQLSASSKSLIDFIFEFEKSQENIIANAPQGVRIMTVHKSKGLEFEHVILCDIIGGGRNDTENFLYEYDMQHGWEIKLKVKNREFYDDDYADLKNLHENLDKQEEINKLYVAMTRAKNSLIIIKKIDINGKNPSYFTPYTKNKTEYVEYIDLAEIKQGEIVKSKQAKVNKKDVKKIELLKVANDETSGQTQDNEKNLHAIYFGLALHYLLEMCIKFDEISIKNANLAMRNKFAKYLDTQSLDDIQNRAIMLVNNADFLSITSGAKLYKEQMLNFAGATKQLDLLCEKGDEMFIIDYKSSDFSVEENVKQVSEYKEILGKIYPQKSIKAGIFYILKSEIKFLSI